MPRNLTRDEIRDRELAEYALRLPPRDLDDERFREFALRLIRIAKSVSRFTQPPNTTEFLDEIEAEIIRSTG